MFRPVQPKIATVDSIWDTADPIKWIEREFYVPELGGPLQLAPYQKDCLRFVLTPDGAGMFPFSTILWSDIKKSLKSTIAAAVALWRAVATPWGSIKIVANDLKQADSRVAFYIRRAIMLNPRLQAICRLKNYLVEISNHATIEAIPIDPQGEAGGNDDLIVFSEFWAATSKAAKILWTELTLSPTKYGKSFRWIETYAGFEGESVMLEQLYNSGVKSKQAAPAPFAQDYDPPLEATVNSSGRQFTLWNTVPRLAWQTPEYYAQERTTLTPAEFKRVHENGWASSSSRFVEKAQVEACFESRYPSQITKLPWDEAPVIGAIDGGVSSDNFAIVGLSRCDLVLFPDTAQEKSVPFFKVKFIKAYVPPPGGKIDFALPEQFIRDISQEYNILEWAYDEYQLHDMGTRLAHDGVGYFRVFSQTTDRLMADKHLYDIIVQRRLLLPDGFNVSPGQAGLLKLDPFPGGSELVEHLTNANAKTEGNEGNKLRLVKRAAALKIDLAVCLSMAAYEAKRLNLG